VQSLVALSDVDTKILLSYKKRSNHEQKFFDLLAKKFTWTQVSRPVDGSVLFLVKKNPRFWLLEQGPLFS